jgi:hypothetical protein
MNGSQTLDVLFILDQTIGAAGVYGKLGTRCSASQTSLLFLAEIGTGLMIELAKASSLALGASRLVGWGTGPALVTRIIVGAFGNIGTMCSTISTGNIGSRGGLFGLFFTVETAK